MTDSFETISPSPETEYILVLSTTHHTLLAEEILRSVNIRYLPIPKPLKAVSDCGMAIQIDVRDLSRACDALKNESLAVRVFVKKITGEIEEVAGQ